MSPTRKERECHMETIGGRRCPEETEGPQAGEVCDHCATLGHGEDFSGVSTPALWTETALPHHILNSFPWGQHLHLCAVKLDSPGQLKVSTHPQTEMSPTHWHRLGGSVDSGPGGKVCSTTSTRYRETWAGSAVEPEGNESGWVGPELRPSLTTSGD